jgi:prevent-host-death family protein
MASVPVSKLKAELSRYLRTVRRGGEVQITERGVPIARLVGMPPPGPDRQRIARLVRSGVLSQGHGDARAVLEVAPVAAGDADLSGALSEDREDRL